MMQYARLIYGYCRRRRYHALLAAAAAAHDSASQPAGWAGDSRQSIGAPAEQTRRRRRRRLVYTANRAASRPGEPANFLAAERSLSLGRLRVSIDLTRQPVAGELMPPLPLPPTLTLCPAI